MRVRPADWTFLGLPRPLLVLLGNTTVVLVLLTVGYFVVPFRVEPGETVTWARLGVSGLLLVLIVLVFRRHARRSREMEPAEYYQIQWLLSALYLLVLAFALAYAFVSRYAPEQFTGIADRTDALYFSVTIVSTVGFGDVHASGDLGQIMTTVHMLFNLIYLGTAFRLLSNMRAGGPMAP
jgi:hypothetical protein